MVTLSCAVGGSLLGLVQCRNSRPKCSRPLFPLPQNCTEIEDVHPHALEAGSAEDEVEEVQEADGDEKEVKEPHQDHDDHDDDDDTETGHSQEEIKDAEVPKSADGEPGEEERQDAPKSAESEAGVAGAELQPAEAAKSVAPINIGEASSSALLDRPSASAAEACSPCGPATPHKARLELHLVGLGTR